VGEEGGVPVSQAVARQPLVEPERGRDTIANLATGDRAVEREAFSHNFVEEGGGGRRIPKVPPRTLVPVFPGQTVGLMQFVDEVEEETPVLPVEILDAEATLLHRQHNLVPSD
jgi:hypothetical protein